MDKELTKDIETVLVFSKCGNHILKQTTIDSIPKESISLLQKGKDFYFIVSEIEIEEITLETETGNTFQIY